jgi:hypothetical protein
LPDFLNTTARGPLRRRARQGFSMPIDPESIQPGKCYRSKGGEKNSEKYTIVAVTRGIVTYQSWTTDPNRLSLRTNVGSKALAEVIFKEIPCPSRDPEKKIEYFDPS